jgi:hypothetical protein
LTPGFDHDPCQCMSMTRHGMGVVWCQNYAYVGM